MSRVTDAIASSWTYSEFLVSKMIDEYARGHTENGDRLSIHASIVKALRRVLNFYDANGADTGMDNTDIEGVISKINEFAYSLYLDIDDFTAQVGSEEDALGSGKPIIISTALPTDFVSFTLTATTDGQTVFTMPYNASSIADPQYTKVTLNDADPIEDTDYTLAGTTFTWTGEYPLDAGWKFEVRLLIHT